MGQTAAERRFTDVPPLSEGEIITGAIFNEPMRVETVRANGPGLWDVGVLDRLIHLRFMVKVGARSTRSIRCYLPLNRHG